MSTDSGKVIWITGASSGIGEAVVKELASGGATLILSARRSEELERVAKEAGLSQVIVMPFDLSAPDTIPEVVAKVLKKVGKVDVLINNGGISQRSLAKETNLETDRRIMEINYFGTVALTKAILPHFLERKSGQFVVVTSLTGKFGTPYRSTYSASKHALHGIFDSLRAEHHDDGIKVTLVCPGFVQTNISVNALKGDGSPSGEMDRKTNVGISAAACAKSLVRAMRKGKQEIYVGKLEKYGVYVKRFFPTLASILIRKVKVK